MEILRWQCVARGTSLRCISYPPPVKLRSRPKSHSWIIGFRSRCMMHVRSRNAGLGLRSGRWTKLVALLPILSIYRHVYPNRGRLTFPGSQINPSSQVTQTTRTVPRTALHCQIFDKVWCQDRCSIWTILRDETETSNRRLIANLGSLGYRYSLSAGGYPIRLSSYRPYQPRVYHYGTIRAVVHELTPFLVDVQALIGDIYEPCTRKYS